MSAPSAGSPNGSPVPGYYPDPSIPGYIRYWNGSSWTPGTSRPAPGPGEPAPAPPGEASSLPATRTGDSAVDGRGDEEDERDEIDLGRAQPQSRVSREALPEVRRRAELTAPDPSAGQEFTDWGDPRRLHGGAPDPGSAWQATPLQQPGFGEERQQDFSWGAPAEGPPAAPAAPDALPAPDAPAVRDAPGTPDVPASSLPADPPAPAGPSYAPGDGGYDPRAGWDAGATEPPVDQVPQADPTVGIRMPRRTPGASGHGPHTQAAGDPAAPDPTAGIRVPRPDPAHGDQATAPGHGGPSGRSAAQPEPTVGLRRSDVLSQGTPGADTDQRSGQQPAAGYQQPPVPHDPYGGQVRGQAPGFPPQAAPDAAARPSWAQPAQHDAAGYGVGAVPGQAPAQAPLGQRIPGQTHPGGPGVPAGPGAGPWRPPADDPFAEAAQDARPAALGRRLVARLIDGLVTTAVGAAVALPFVGRWTTHIEDEIEAANQAGVTRTIWLVDGTTGVYLAVILGVFLLFGLLYEALPTAKWGRTLGKKLLGVQVLDVERQDAPGFGAALRRWLTYHVLAFLAVGVLNVIWCLFDRPWRQCWHDKAARTFVAGR